MVLRSGLLAYDAANALVGWALLAVLFAVAVERALSGAPIRAAAALVALGVALVPTVAARDPRETVAWEVLALVVATAVAPYVVSVGAWLAYLAVAALALLVAAELDAFTDVEMTAEFAVGFVVVVTMAVAGLWVIARYAADTYLGTALVADNEAAMWDLIAATGAGVLAGLGFELYVRRVSPGHAPGRRWRGGTQ